MSTWTIEKVRLNADRPKSRILYAVAKRELAEVDLAEAWIVPGFAFQEEGISDTDSLVVFYIEHGDAKRVSNVIVDDIGVLLSNPDYIDIFVAEVASYILEQLGLRSYVTLGGSNEAVVSPEITH